MLSISKTKEYLVQTTAIEARYLTGKNDNGLSDPFVKLRIAGLSDQATSVVKDCISPVWNQSFTFTGIVLTDSDFENAELAFEVWSQNRFMGNSLIGMYSVGLSTLYRNANHEFYNVWLTLTSPLDPETGQGFLFVDCFVIAPGDSPPVHSINDKINQDVEEEDEELNIDNMTFEELRAYQEKKLGIVILGKPSIARKAFQLSCYIMKSEGICLFNALIGSSKPSS